MRKKRGREDRESGRASSLESREVCGRFVAYLRAHTDAHVRAHARRTRMCTRSVTTTQVYRGIGSRKNAGTGERVRCRRNLRGRVASAPGDNQTGVLRKQLLFR